MTLMSSAIDFVKNVQPKKLLSAPHGLRREISMEEIIQLTDELAQSHDRHGHRLEPLKSALELHRERFAQRLERSTADRTRRQEEAWARLDRCPSPISEHPKIKRYGSFQTVGKFKIMITSNRDCLNRNLLLWYEIHLNF